MLNPYLWSDVCAESGIKTKNRRTIRKKNASFVCPQILYHNETYLYSTAQFHLKSYNLATVFSLWAVFDANQKYVCPSRKIGHVLERDHPSND